MALKAKITADEFKALPEVLQAEYKPTGGVAAAEATEFLLDAEGVEDVTGLKNNSAKLLQEKQEVERQLKEWKAIGDPKKAKEALLKLQQLEEQKLREEGDFKKIQDQMVQRHAEEQQALKDEIAKRDADLGKLLIDNVANSAILAEKGKAKLLLPHLKAQVKVVRNEATGEPEAVVVDASGTPRIATGSGSRMTVLDLVKEMKADPEFGIAFEPSGSTGSGASATAKKQSAGGAKPSVALTDQAALNANIKDIAEGKMAVSEA